MEKKHNEPGFVEKGECEKGLMNFPWILVLCHEFPPLGGGAGKNLFLLCRELTQRGLKVKVWTSDPGISKRLTFDFEVDYIEVRRRERFVTTFRGMANFVLEVWRRSFRKKYISPKPQFVLSVLGIPAGLGGMFLARKLKVPHVVWYHGSDIHAGKISGPGKLQQFLLKKLWQKTDLHFFVSQSLLAQAKNSGLKTKLEPLILPACPSPEILASDLTRQTEPKYFLFLGRFDEVKNPLLLLAAIQILKSQAFPKIKIRMVGSGKLNDEIKKYVRVQNLTEWVSIERAITFDKVPEMLSGAMAMVLPSRIEGFNTTILEAAHFGVPTIASDTAGIRDFIVQGETGLLFEENNAEALANSIKVIVGDAHLRNTLGEKAKRASERFTPSLVSETFLRGVTSLLPQFEGFQAKL